LTSANLARSSDATFVACFFTGAANIVFELAGEYGDYPPVGVKAICAVSPSIDLRASTSLDRPGRRNWLYQHYFPQAFEEPEFQG